MILAFIRRISSEVKVRSSKKDRKKLDVQSTDRGSIAATASWRSDTFTSLGTATAAVSARITSTASRRTASAAVETAIQGTEEVLEELFGSDTGFDQERSHRSGAIAIAATASATGTRSTCVAVVVSAVVSTRIASIRAASGITGARSAKVATIEQTEATELDAVPTGTASIGVARIAGVFAARITGTYIAGGRTTSDDRFTRRTSDDRRTALQKVLETGEKVARFGTARGTCIARIGCVAWSTLC